MRDEFWTDFLEKIKEARSKIGNPEVVWYRGQIDQRWSLSPGIHRVVGGLDKEQFLFREFSRRADNLLGRRESDWETLFEMQHYGLPTRLIDWTEVLGIALAFAYLGKPDDDREAAIYLLNPDTLNRESINSSIKYLEDDTDFAYKNIYWHKKPFVPNAPVAINPMRFSKRIQAQRGTFTIHGDDPRGLEKSSANHLAKVVIPQKARAGINEFLEYSNLNEYSIYPDMAGMAKFIRGRAGFV